MTLEAYFFAAMYVSEVWYKVYDEHFASKNKHLKQRALHARARGVVLFDRVINGNVSMRESVKITPNN